MVKYIGFDIDCNKVVACVVQQSRNDYFETFGSDIDSMQKFLKKQKSPGIEIRLAFEISGQAGFIYDSLIGSVDVIKVANPYKTTWIYRTSKKTDSLDARKLAVLMSIGELPEVYMPSKEVRQWRSLINHRKKLVDNACQTKNRIRAIIKSQGLNKGFYKGSLWTKTNRLWLKSLFENNDSFELWRLELNNYIVSLEALEKQISGTTEYLDGYLAKQPGAVLLMSIPGVGPRTSEAILAYTDDIGRFSNYKKYCSYFGLTPKLDQSGMTRRVGHISKQGPSVVRWVLCESSWKVVRYVPAMKAFYERVMAGQKSRKKIAIVAVCRKMVSVMRAMLISGELFNESMINEEMLKSA
jgi:transposase